MFYRVKRGEATTADEVIDNDIAARVLLSFDLEQPWTSHQTNRILEELHSQIFGRPEVTAKRIVALSDIHQTILEKRGEIEQSLVAGYTITQYFLVYLLKLTLQGDDLGKTFCAFPERFISQDNGRWRLKQCIEAMLTDLIIDLNFELKERKEADNPFDYKRELKNAGDSRKLAQSILSSYQKAVKRERVPSFSQAWADSQTLNHV